MEWVFGKKQDLIVFSGPILLSLVLSTCFSLDALEMSYLFFLVQVLFNLPHSYLSYWVAYGCRASHHQNLQLLVGLPVFLFALNTAMFYTMGPEIILVFHAHLVIFHFLRQQHAWFFISSRNESDRLGKLINKNAIHALTTGIFIASICEGNYRQCFEPHDLIVLPGYLFNPLMVWGGVSAVLYTLYHIAVWMKTKSTNWSAHHLLISSAVCWWMVRLGPASANNFLLITLHHTVPYLYLGYRYLKTGESQVSRSKEVLPALVYLGLIVISFTRTYPESFWQFSGTANDMYFIIIRTITFTHFTFDMFLWTRSHNPGWTRALFKKNDQNQIATEVPEKLAA